MTIQDKQTEEKIFEAATDVFEEKGLAGARMQDISDRAGINKALLHYYFRTKEKLFNAVFEMVAKKMLSRFAPVFEEDMSLEDKIRFFFREHIAFLQKNPKLPAFIINEINQNPERIKKLLENIDFRGILEKMLEKHKHEIHKYNIDEKTIPQIMTSIVAISVFPFAAKGLLETILNSAGYDFDKYIEERKEFAAEFVIKAITK
ncbi:MAG: TetR/AcrR family transcriptional regulator [Odoribacter sp.]|nr:TetR/AcrR family transcriptional regulator [Odoribacter sp.]